MNRVARSPMLVLPGTLFLVLTHLVPSPGPPAEAANELQQPLQLDAARAALMKAHYHEAIGVQDAVIRGELAAVAPAAKALAGAPSPGGLPPKVLEHERTMKAAAGRASTASTLSAASREAATMLSTCGECHTAAGTRPALPVPPPSAVGGIVGHMLDHQRAVDQMMQGLVLPSSSLWSQGAESLKAAPLRRSDEPRNTDLTREMRAAETRVHQMAEQAAAMTAPADRANQYAQILTTCAECHSANRKLWGPSRR